VALETPEAAIETTTSAPAVARGRVPWLPWAIAGALALALLIALMWPAPAPSPASLLQFSIASPTPGALPRQLLTPHLALSPTGRRMAVAESEGLWLWTAESGDWQLLADTAGATAPFFSPDGAHVAFFAGGELRRVAAAGGPPSLIVRVPAGNAGSWSQNDAILYTQWLGKDAGLWLVSARGGDARLLAPTPNPINLQAFPSWLPDNRHYVFVQGAFVKPVGERQICVGSIDGGAPECVANGDSLAQPVAVRRLHAQVARRWT
jgi:hypothetical protein